MSATTLRRLFATFAVTLVFMVPAGAGRSTALAHTRIFCGTPARGHAACFVVKIRSASAGSGPTGLNPAQIHAAYSLPCAPGGNATSMSCRTPKSFGPQTIAIVEANHNPTLESDLGVYDSTYKLPACTQANGCLQIVNGTGGTALPTTASAPWAIESALDVEMAHMTCQTCKILVLEAASSADPDLAAAANEAAALGATEISLSFGSNEYASETVLDSLYSHPGIAVVAAAGDTANQAWYPASLPGVVAVGGTTLTMSNRDGYGGESAWSGTGSGCSAYKTAASWQTSLPTWSSTGCSTGRGTADVAMVADSNTGIAMYSSAPSAGGAMWREVGGTSLGAPIVAAIFALAGGVPAGVTAPSILYRHPASFRDVTTGTAGSCGTTMCSATTGYDGPTGLGSPNGVSGF